MQAVRLAKEKFGDRFDALTIAEEDCLSAIADGGCHEISEIAAATGLAVADVVAALKRLVARRAIEKRLVVSPVRAKSKGSQADSLYFLPI